MSEPVYNPQVAYHRNGSGGRPCWVVHFETDRQDVDGTVLPSTMVGIIPARPEQGECFVLDVDLLAEGKIDFGVNAWRGDHYETPLRAAIIQHQTDRNIKDGYDGMEVVL